MKSYLFLYLLCSNIILYGQIRQPSNCHAFKKGIFKDRDVSEGQVLIKRTKTKQIEISHLTKIEVISKVTWVSECEYELLIKRSNAPNKDDIIGKIIRVRIIEVNNNLEALIEVNYPNGNRKSFWIEKIK